MSWYKFKSKFLTWFGDIKYSLYPPQLYWCPVPYAMTGKETRRAMAAITPGDLILRGFSSYVDGLFIPGIYSHTGVYVGEGKVIHAIAEGVSECDIIDFLRCDRFCILHPRQGATAAIARARAYLAAHTPYDFNFQRVKAQGQLVLDNRLYCHELGAACYPDLGIVKLVPALMWGLIKGRPAYLANSFLKNPNFRLVLGMR